MKFVTCGKRIFVGIILRIIIQTELAQQVPSFSLQINVRDLKNSKSVSICDSWNSCLKDAHKLDLGEILASLFNKLLSIMEYIKKKAV